MLKNLHEIKLFIFFIIHQLLLALSASINDYVVNSTVENDGLELVGTLSEKIWLALFIAPIIETLIFSLLSNELFLKLFKNKIIAIVLSSVFFGLTHSYSLAYVFFSFLAGFLLNNYYFIVREKKGYLLATLLVFLLHFNHNGIGLLLGK